jgi:cobyrinic acid a,c-diamide synthase
VTLIDNQFFRATNSALAKLLDTNVVLVIDSNGITRGVAPLLMGYQTFDTNVNIVGVILNKVAGERHIQDYTNNINISIESLITH